MLSIVKRLIGISGPYKKRLILAIVVSFFEGFFTLSPELVVMYVVYRIVTGTVTPSDVWLSLGALILGVVLRAGARRLVDALQSSTGYLLFAEERMKIGEHLKRLPMGYFTEGAIGNVTSVVTSDIVFAEGHGMGTMSKIVNGWVSMILGSIFMLYIDWRVALVAIATFMAGAATMVWMDKVAKKQAKIRQAGFSRFTSKVLEFIKGIGVVKAFNMTGDRGRRMNDEFQTIRDEAISFELEFANVFGIFSNWFALGTGCVILAVSWMGFHGTMDPVFVIMMVIYIFYFFQPFQVLGSVAALARIMDAGLDRYEKVMNAPIIDAEGKDIELERFDVAFDNVSFAYEEEQVLKDVAFNVPEKSMTALVGKSGCGKTTVTNLVARFWDVQSGAVRVGGVDVKEMTCDSLLKHISMVFQNVYLFHDTILNNILFGKPDATMAEVEEACKKARCYDFIMALEDGFETMVDEGGTSLSGGEKQRISIARAILKDAPIVLLDEATSGVDPDNEKFIQQAIDELIKEKTLIVIAHKLTTVRHADQILVMDKGRIVQRGVHDTLAETDGLYKKFWERRTKARSWKIQR